MSQRHADEEAFNAGESALEVEFDAWEARMARWKPVPELLVFTEHDEKKEAVHGHLPSKRVE
eukprot:2112041-Karenia_brevis.AAC.1